MKDILEDFEIDAALSPKLRLVGVFRLFVILFYFLMIYVFTFPVLNIPETTDFNKGVMYLISFVLTSLALLTIYYSIIQCINELKLSSSAIKKKSFRLLSVILNIFCILLLLTVGTFNYSRFNDSFQLTIAIIFCIIPFVVTIVDIRLIKKALHK